ncbi:hypothetical protein H632_c1444p1 [Helicosporidium sp. ATCC 50920]|nr:hypothetical protein H632_c1444p1 [Helicosporidium sp. ATCC 50920]|eukprot:KDD74268.1 hypothetical protein H632_c1444p1 [Helicosporidium sp. ATCC 50920]
MRMTVVQGKMVGKNSNNKLVFLGVSAIMLAAALPLMNKKVYEREQGVAAMRDNYYDKDAARNDRLSAKKN